MHKITTKDFPDLDFGDVRRSERFLTIIDNLSTHPGISIPKQNANWYDTKATYSFFKNEDVTLESLQAAIRSYGITQLENVDQVLIIHDISSISYDDLKAEGLGYLANKEGRGILCMSSIAVSEQGTPLALVNQHTWVRPIEELGKAKDRKQKEFEHKESYNWYQSISQVNEHIGDSLQKIHIADREADIYDLFFCGYTDQTEILVRAAHNRHLTNGSHLWDVVAEQSSISTVELQVPDKKGRNKIAIQAEVRYQQVEILRPSKSKHQYQSVELTAIEVRQVSEKLEWQEEPVCWKLLTTLAVTTPAQALQCVRWYTYRWLIERFHYVLKSGTKVEELQLKQAESLQKAIHVFSIAAMRIMQMVYLSRANPELSCELILTKAEWTVLYVLIHKKKELPPQPPTIDEAIRWIGKLGGHLGRRSDGPPGLQAVWVGYQRIMDAANFYEIFALENLGKG